jgi:hypothetical protein
MSTAPTQQGCPDQGTTPGEKQLHGFGVHRLSWWIVNHGAGRQLMSTMSTLDSFNPSLTRYDRNDPAPVLPLREEPDLLSWLETSGRLVADEEDASSDQATVEEEELSALMGDKEDYSKDDENQEENWED